MAFSDRAVLLPVIGLPNAAPVEDIGPLAARLLKLLADGTRRRIVLMLMRGETCNCELADELGLAENLISHHVKQLREAGFVRERRDRRDARWVYYTLDPEVLSLAWNELERAFSPAALGARRAPCGPIRSGAMEVDADD